VVYVVVTGYASADKFGYTYLSKLYGVKSADGGNAFGSPVVLADVTRSAYPHVVSNATHIIAAYTNEGMESLISSDGGSTFLPFPLDDLGMIVHYRAVYSDLAINGSNIHAVWSNDRELAPSPRFWNVLFNKLDLNGPTLEEPV